MATGKGLFVLHEWGDSSGTDETRHEPAEVCSECRAVVLTEDWVEHREWHRKQEKALGSLAESITAIATVTKLAFRRGRYGRDS